MNAGPGYPLSLDVSGRRVLVVGGGPVAARRTRGLLAAGADVLVVSPWLCEDLADLERAGTVEWSPREFRRDDLDDMWLVHTATGDRAVDRAVADEAADRRVWCVRADDAAASAAWTPAVARSGDVTVAITSSGDPVRSARLRDAIALALDTGSLPIRRHRGGAGSVALVGGGPGDPGLITTRGRRLLAEADVVVVDRLAPRQLLEHLDTDVVVIDAGKTAGNHPLPQEEINRLLISYAHAGRRVVRLKGGDPFVLGRGGEEALACRAAGVPVEVVPGVTSAVAVPAAAGIPVTHRGRARQVTIASGHEGLDWPSLAKLDGTLVLLMAVTALPSATAELQAHGLAPNTPAAVVESGFGPEQRTTVGTLATIAGLAAERQVRAPAVVVIGSVVDLHEALG
ncbi:MAG: uroporphyrin-III C-methyltransferase / precorrin-2 dehydrogenase / sirohydrochlorin ferrochelatase [Actinomycetota bacterium]|nr:uroporphyrin-III C-methyltransferase / precorrin-2 dehydrogenase / sirohydrochlorin ferrochelatase [Actinomycetota bacterium]